MPKRELWELARYDYRDAGLKRNYASRTATRKDGLVIHYNGGSGSLLSSIRTTADWFSHLRGIEDQHIRQGWFGFGYNLAASPWGDLTIVRGEGAGAHNPGDSDRDGRPDNIDAWGLYLPLSKTDRPTDTLLAGVRRIIEAADTEVWGHGESRATQCPGPYMQSWINNYLKEMPVMPDPNEFELGNTGREYFEEAQRTGMYSKHTKPGDIWTAEKGAVFMGRATEPGGFIDQHFAVDGHVHGDAGGVGMTSEAADRRYAKKAHGHTIEGTAR